MGYTFSLFTYRNLVRPFARARARSMATKIGFPFGVFFWVSNNFAINHPNVRGNSVALLPYPLSPNEGSVLRFCTFSVSRFHEAQIISGPRRMICVAAAGWRAKAFRPIGFRF